MFCSTNDVEENKRSVVVKTQNSVQVSIEIIKEGEEESLWYDLSINVILVRVVLQVLHEDEID